MRHDTFNPLLFWIAPGLISCIFMKLKKNSVWYNFYQGTSVSITFYIFEHYQLWMMDSKAQRVFFPKTPKLCVWHTEVRSCYHFKLVSHFQLWFPIWGVLVNRSTSAPSTGLESRWWRFNTNHRTGFTEEMHMTIACNISCSPTVAPLLTLSLYYPYCRWMHGGRQE